MQVRTLGGVVFVALVLVGCGSERSSLSPTPTPAPTHSPTPPSFQGTVTETLTGTPVSGYTATITGLRVTLAAPGYVTRETNLNTPTVDLIREAAPFDLSFYRQLVRNGFDAPGTLEPLRRQTQAPRIYVRTVDEAGTPINAQTLAVVTSSLSSGIVEAWSGGVVSLAGIESGPGTRVGTPGWITITWQPHSPDGRCGQASVGGDTIELFYAGTQCGCNGSAMRPRSIKHELGHAMGFWHTGEAGDLMSGLSSGRCDQDPSARERHHAALAYHRPVGSRDVDIDPTGSTSSLRTARRGPVVVD